MLNVESLSVFYGDAQALENVSLTVKQTAASQLTCILAEYNPAGTVVQALAFNAFPVGGYVTSSKAITIATGNSLSVLCAFNKNDANIGDARVLSVEY